MHFFVFHFRNPVVKTFHSKVARKLRHLIEPADMEQMVRVFMAWWYDIDISSVWRRSS
jgi:hypothetical protein